MSTPSAQCVVVPVGRLKLTDRVVLGDVLRARKSFTNPDILTKGDVVIVQALTDDGCVYFQNLFRCSPQAGLRLDWFDFVHRPPTRLKADYSHMAAAPAPSSLAGGEVCDLSDAIDQFISDAIANSAVEISGDDTIQWCRPALEQTLVSSLAGCGYRIAALSPEAPARDGVDLEGLLTTALTDELQDGGAEIPYSIIAERVAARVADEASAPSCALTTAAKEVLSFLQNAPLESGICCCGDPISGHGYGSGHSPVDDLSYHSSQVAEKLQAALTPRHEAPACDDCGSPLNSDGECTRDLAEREADDRHETPASEGDDGPCTCCDDTGITIQTERPCACAAGIPFEAPAETITSAELIANTDYARGAVRVPGETEDRRIYGQPEAPAEGSGEREEIAHEIYDFLNERFPDGALPGGVQLFADAGDHTDAGMKHEAGCDELAGRILALRARSSAPEARDGEAVTVSAVCGSCDGAKVVQSQTYGHVICAHCRGSGVETYTRTVTAAPSADKLRIAVEAMQGAIDWDKRHGYRMPYRVRDPLYAALDLSTPDALKGDTK